MNKISIIIPIYNAEKYLEDTLKSVIGQTLKEIEIICINDGSKDNSLNIINRFIEKDVRIKLINKENEGVWKARLDGIKHASGEYITFVDSDDIIENDFLEKLYLNITEKQSDIAVCGFKRIDAITGKVISKEMKYNSEKIIDKSNLAEVISINTALWNKMYKTSILKQVKTIENPPRILEDMMFLTLIYLNVNKISFVDEYLYNYIIRDGSAMNTLKENEIEKIRKPMLEVRNQYITNNCSKEKMQILSAMVFLHFGISLMLRVYQNDNYNFSKEYKDNLKFLNKEFPEWKKNKYTCLSYSFTHGMSNLKLAIVKKVYRLHLFKVFLIFYKLITNKLKIDIKW